MPFRIWTSHTICRYTEHLLMCACRPAVSIRELFGKACSPTMGKAYTLLLLSEIKCDTNWHNNERKIIMQTQKNNQQHIIIRARCTGQFILLHEHSSVFKIIYTDCPGNVCPGKWLSGKHPLPHTTIVVKFEEINLKFKKVQDPHSITTVIKRHSVLSTL